MTDLAIRVENLSKQYEIGATEASYSTIRDQLIQMMKGLANPFQRQEPPPKVWALKDISFDVKQGEVVGIIGRNGAGKSTLLKLLSQITEPTQGRILSYGRVGSLLEVGTGFHPELTGRENIYLNGAILGMTRAEINRKFDEIVDFSGVETFIDTPVKRYSSGMGLRLGFAVAAHLEPEILIVDEVLAVGDAEFQKKCIGKMSDVAGAGRTVLFVSHNMSAVKSLCTRAISLESGEIVEDGEVNHVVSKYLSKSLNNSREQIWHDIQTAPGNDIVRLSRVSIRPANGTIHDQIGMKTPLTIEVGFWNQIEGSNLSINIQLLTQDGTVIFASSSASNPNFAHVSLSSDIFQAHCQVPGQFLNSGMHQITVMIVKDLNQVLHREDGIVTFDVVDDSPELRGGKFGWHGKVAGVVRPALEWQLEKKKGIQFDKAK